MVSLMHHCLSAATDHFPEGSANTLANYLSTHLSQLFPPSPSESPFHDLAYALVQGVVVPPDTEVAWLGACMAGADGWVNVCVGILREGSIS